MGKHGVRKEVSLAKRVVMLLLALVISANVGVMVAIAVPYIADEAKATQVQEAYTVPQDEPTAELRDESGAESLPHPVVNWDALLRDNPDVVGWLYVPGTNIDYPVVAAPASDPEYYLRRDLSGSWSTAGTLYLDAGCDRDFSSPHSVIFGHHLINGSMFSAFADYVDESFFNEHRTIYLLTSDKVIELKAVAVNIVDANVEEKRTTFCDADDYAAYWQSQLTESEVVASDAPQAPKQSFCFVTCSYQTSNARTLVYAVAAGEIANPS